MRFPDLTHARRIAVDTETYDPGLKQRGPGWATGDGHIIGISVATDDWSGYFPIRHCSGNLLERDVWAWLHDTLRGEQPKIFANASYDIGWLRHHDIKVNGEIHDVQIAAPLLDEHRKSYSLQSLGEDYCGEGKEDLSFIAHRYHIPEKQIMSRLQELPAEAVAPYATQDAVLTLKVHDVLYPKIIEENLTDVYRMECKLVKMLVAMRMRGVRVDVDNAEAVRTRVSQQEIELDKQIRHVCGRVLNVYASADIAKAYDELGLQYGRTPKGAPSFTAELLAADPNPIAALILKRRKLGKLVSTFIDGMILNNAKDGRIHCQFNQLRGDGFGTVSGRFSSSNPNLQQVPARDEITGPMVRGLFLPEDGCQWGAFDYSQQEPRLTVHFAKAVNLPGADEAVGYYWNDDKPDYHQMVANMAGITRKHAKTINLGLAYGMGQQKLSQELGLTLDEAKVIFAQYHEKVPFVKGLTDACSNRAANVGYIRTLLGRRCRFNSWEPAEFGSRDSAPEADARRFVSDPDKGEWYGKRIRRAFTYRAMNRLIQGSAADQTKAAMVQIYEAGYLPHIQVHDELDFSVENAEQSTAIKDIMQTVVPLKVPSKVDVDLGRTWGAAKYGE